MDSATLADETLQTIRSLARQFDAAARGAVGILRAVDACAGARGVCCAAAIDRDMHTALLEARRVGLGHVPVEQREQFGEYAVAGAVGHRSVRDAAVAVARRHHDVRDAFFAEVVDTVLVGVQKDVLVVLREPAQHRDVAERHDRVRGRRHDQCLGLDDLVQPLVPDHQFVAACGNVREREVSVLVAGCGRDRRARAALRIERDLTVRRRQQVVRARVEQRHVGGARHALVRDLAGYRGGACQIVVGCGLGDAVRVHETDHGVEPGRAEFLEVHGLLDAGESVLGWRAFERLRLPPDLAGTLPRGGRVGDHVVARRGNVENQRMADEREVDCVLRQLRPVRGQRRLVGRSRRNDDRGRRTHRGVRAGVDDADFVASRGGCRSVGYGVLVVGAPRAAEQRIAERHAVGVVGLLAGGVAGTPCGIDQDDVEAAEPAFVQVVLAVDRRVVFVDVDAELCRHPVVGVGGDGDLRLCDSHPGLDFRAAHSVTGGAVRGARRIPWQDRDVVMLGRIESSSARKHLLRQRISDAERAARAEAAVCVDGGAVGAGGLARAAAERADAAGRYHRHVRLVETRAERARADRRRASRIDLESQVFLNDPAVVGDLALRDRSRAGGLRLRRRDDLDVQTVHHSGRQERHRHLRRRAVGALRVARRVCERAGRGRAGGRGAERTVCAQRYRCACAICGQYGREWVAARVAVVCEHAGASNRELRCDGAVVAIGHGDGLGAGAARPDVQGHGRGVGGCGPRIPEVGEGIGANRIGVGGVDEGAVGLEADDALGGARHECDRAHGDVVRLHVAVDRSVQRHLERIRHSRRQDRSRQRTGAGGRTRTCDLQKALHATVGLVARGQAQLAVEQRKDGRAVGRRGRGDRHRCD